MARSGAIFDRKGHAVHPSARLNDSKQIAAFLTASTQLAARTFSSGLMNAPATKR
jgi:hypothetical protein